MKFVPVFVGVALLLSSCASGPSAHQVIGSNLASPDVTYSELNLILKKKGFMRMRTKKRVGQYSLVEFANWEIVFENEQVVFADTLANGKQAENWIQDTLNPNAQAKNNQTSPGKRIIIIE